MKMKTLTKKDIKTTEEIISFIDSKLEKRRRYFVSEYFNEKKKVFIPSNFEKRIFDIIRDKSIDEFEPLREVDEEDIEIQVYFIMSEVANLIKDENYLIVKSD